MRTLPSKLKRLIFNYDWEIVEVQGAIFKIVWGIWLVIPFDTFDGNVVYTALARITSETILGIFVFLLGVSHLLSIAYGTPKLRRHFIFVACLFWVFMSMVFMLSRAGSALIPLTLVISFFLGVNFLRLGVGTKSKIPALLRKRLGYETPQ